MNYSLLQVIKVLETFAQDHKQVSSFEMKDPLEMLNDSVNAFPTICGDLKNISANNRDINISIDLYFCDLVHKDLSNRFEVLSDQILIAMDLKPYILKTLQDDNFLMPENFTLEPFYEKSDKEWTGVKMNFQIKLFNYNDNCQIPLV